MFDKDNRDFYVFVSTTLVDIATLVLLTLGSNDKLLPQLNLFSHVFFIFAVLLTIFITYVSKSICATGYSPRKYRILSLDEYENTFLNNADYSEDLFIIRRDSQYKKFYIPYIYKNRLRVETTDTYKTTNCLKAEAHILETYEMSCFLYKGKRVPFLSKITEAKELIKTEIHLPSDMQVVQLP